MALFAKRASPGDYSDRSKASPVGLTAPAEIADRLGSSCPACSIRWASSSTGVYPGAWPSAGLNSMRPIVGSA